MTAHEQWCTLEQWVSYNNGVWYIKHKTMGEYRITRKFPDVTALWVKVKVTHTDKLRHVDQLIP